MRQRRAAGSPWACCAFLSKGWGLMTGTGNGDSSMPQPMHDDPAMQAEHQAAMNLVKDAEITHRAVRDGAWSDPATWEDGRIPGKDAVVQVPEGVTVTYDAQSSVSLFKVRVDGELSFA